MKALGLVVAAAAALCATPAAAGLYGTVGVSRIESGNTLGLTAGTARLGADVMRNFGVEGEVSLGFGSDTQEIDGVEADVKLRNDYGVYLRGILPMTDNASVFARIGYGATSIRATAGTEAVKESEEAVRYGVGAEFFFDAVNGVRFDLTRIDEEEFEADIYTISYARRF